MQKLNGNSRVANQIETAPSQEKDDLVNILDISQDQIQFLHKTGDQFVNLPQQYGAFGKKG